MDFGIALSGGGAKGSAHVGALMGLIEGGLVPKYISGTSAGSLVASLYAVGMSISSIEKEVIYLSKYGKKVLDPNLLGFLFALPNMSIHCDTNFNGLLKGNKMEKYFKSLLGDTPINKSSIPIVIPAVDIITGKTIAFTNYIHNKPLIENVIWNSNGRLYEIVRGSCSIPGIFSPKRLCDMVLVDGGLTNNLPVDLLIHQGAKKVIGIDVSSSYSPPNKLNITEILYSSFKIMNVTLRDSMSRLEVLLINIPLPQDAELLGFSRMVEYMEIGYDCIIKSLPKIKKALE